MSGNVCTSDNVLFNSVCELLQKRGDYVTFSLVFHLLYLQLDRNKSGKCCKALIQRVACFSAKNIKYVKTSNMALSVSISSWY